MPAPAGRTQILRGQTAASWWELAIRAPAAHLRPYVRDLCGYFERSAGGVRRRELPGPQVAVIFEFGPPIRVYDAGADGQPSRFPGGFAAGIDAAATFTEHDGVQSGVQVNLTPIGARVFFGLPMSELAGRVVALRDLLPAQHASLSERLEGLPDWDARIDLVERLIQARIAAWGPSPLPLQVVSWACGRIDQRAGAVDLRGLARELGYSHKHVLRLFREHVGIAPKLLARLVRFDRLVQHFKGNGAGSWSDLALEFGYYDQSHLARDVREFTGTTPTEIRRLLSELAAVAGPAETGPPRLARAS